MTKTEVAINNYVWEQFRLDSLTSASASWLGGFRYADYSIRPFFPVQDIEAGATAWSNKTYVVYDSIGRHRTSQRNLYPIRYAQMVYSIKGDLEDIYKWRDFIVAVLDRADVAAREINEYNGLQDPNYDLYFHSLDTYQINTIGQTSKVSELKKDYSTNLLIRYEYHRGREYGQPL